LETLNHVNVFVYSNSWTHVTAADQGVQSAEGKRARYSCCSKPKGSICKVRETIVAATKSNGLICRGRETDILPEANPKGSIY
jgi:hypothetical protein